MTSNRNVLLLYFYSKTYTALKNTWAIFSKSKPAENIVYFSEFREIMLSDRNEIGYSLAFYAK